jgi:hypothetical protein
MINPPTDISPGIWGCKDSMRVIQNTLEESKSLKVAKHFLFIPNESIRYFHQKNIMDIFINTHLKNCILSTVVP